MAFSLITAKKTQFAFILTAYLSLVVLTISLKYNYYLPESYFICLTSLFLCLFIAVKFKPLTPIYPIFLIIYTNAILSVFAIRFGLFHGDSQIDLMFVLNIIEDRSISLEQTYSVGNFPTIHIFSSIIGILIGSQCVQDIYSTVIWVPPIIGMVSSLFIYITVKRIANETTGLLASITWISLPFVSRWLIQFTRTSIAILFLLILGYCLILNYKKGINMGIFIVLLLTIVALVLSHPIVSFFAILSLIFALSFQMVIPSLCHSILKQDLDIYLPKEKLVSSIIVLFACIFIISYWMYIGFAFHPVINVIHEYIKNLTVLESSIFGQIITNKAQSSFLVASSELRLFGLLRVGLFVLASLIGLLFLLLDGQIKNRIGEIEWVIAPLAIFGLFFLTINLTLGVASTTSYRTAVYASTWLILAYGYFINKSTWLNNNEKLWRKIKSAILIILIIPAPFYTGEVVLPSDWLYRTDPTSSIDYQSGENQRFLEYYHFSMPYWINKYTNEQSLFWADGTHSHSAIRGYGNREATFSAMPIKPDGIDIDGLRQIDVNYVHINALMRKSLLIPYGVPPFYPEYNFCSLDQDPRSIKIYDSKEANLYKIEPELRMT